MNYARFLLLSVALLLVACESRKADESPAEAAQTQSGESAAVAPEASAQLASQSVPAPAHVWPEDEVRDAAAESPVRARAAELQAIRPEAVNALKAGDIVFVLVRGNPRAGTVYGSGPYTLDSRLRTAAVHAGLLAEGELGVLKLEVITSDDEHPSIERNGVRPNRWGRYAASYVLHDAMTP